MGRSAARQLAAKGANVLLVSRSVAKLEEALAETKVGAHMALQPRGGRTLT